MLDTNIVSYIIKGDSPATRARNAALLPHESRCISAITEGELYFGLAKQPSAARDASLRIFLSSLSVLPWGRDEARTYGHLRAKQQAAGKRLETMDLLIAAHAIAVGAILVTNDTTFSRLEAVLPVVNWATDL